MGQILKAALRDGFIPHKDDKFLIHGPGGVGKSSLIDMFLGKQRDLVIRRSTPIANQPLHLCPIREMSTTTYTADWQEVDYSRLSRMIAHTTHQMYQKWAEDKVEKKTRESSSTDSAETLKPTAYLASSRHLDSSVKAKFNKMVGRLRSGMRNLFRKTLATTLGDDPDNIEGFFTEFQRGLRELVIESGGGFIQEVLVSHSIRIIDSGGQPQFHDLLSIFIPELSGLVSVFKLCEPLAVRGEVAFYREGYLTCALYKSHYTNEQVIRHDLQVVQSEAMRCGIEHMPNVAFVGTHLDVYLSKSCSESADDKDSLLQSILTETLPQEMQESVLSAGGSLSHVTFKINARTPEKTDFEKVDQLKKLLLERSRVKPKDLPLKWYGYEVALHLLMEELGRQCLSRKECEFIGRKLSFDAPSLNAALEYLRQLNILSFFDSLPSVVFGSSQVILDKITELVTYNLELKDYTGAMSGDKRKFLQQGIISLEILKSPKLSKHYIEGLFEPCHLLDILVSKLVVTKIGEHEYFMPSVMDVKDIYPFSQLPNGYRESSFAIHFSKKIPMVGIYCCTIAYLITQSGWKLLKENGEVVLVARNSTAFEPPQDLPGRLTFFDPLSSYLLIVLEIPATITEEHKTFLYKEIRETLYLAVKQALQTLNYKVMTPLLSFPCPEQICQCSTFPHIAKVDKSHSFLTCPIKPASTLYPVTSDQLMWLTCTLDGESFPINLCIDFKHPILILQVLNYKVKKFLQVVLIQHIPYHCHV